MILEWIDLKCWEEEIVAVKMLMKKTRVREGKRVTIEGDSVGLSKSLENYRER